MNRLGLHLRRAAAVVALGALAAGPGLAVGAVAAAAPGDEVQLTLSESTDLVDGQEVTVEGSGVDPARGFYLSTCVIGTSGPTGPDCAGGPDDRYASAWGSNSQGATVPINPDGTFTDTLQVASVGETMDGRPVDCSETPCAVALFGDHRNGFVYTTDVPVTFAASAGATTGATTDAGSGETTEVEAEQITAESDADSGMSPVWWIVGGIVVVVLVGGGIAYSRKS